MRDRGVSTRIRGETCKYDQNTLNSQGMNKTIIYFFKCSLTLLAYALHCSQLVPFPSPLSITAYKNTCMHTSRLSSAVMSSKETFRLPDSVGELLSCPV